MADILVPFEQEGTKAIVRAWLKQIGDRVALNDPLVELETDKVTQEVASPAAGVLSEILLGTDAEAVPGAVLGRLTEGAEKPTVGIEPDHVVDEPTLGDEAAAPVRQSALSPAVRRAVKQYGIDPAAVFGSGRGGRVTRADVERTAADRESTPVSAVPRAENRIEPTQAQAAGTVRTVPHDRMRLAIAGNMLRSVTGAPHVTAVFECDFTAIMAHRRKHKASFEQQGFNLTFTAYMMAASVQAMRVAPAINSRWFDDRLEIYDDMNIGVGTALGEKGLVVPVVQRAQEASLLGIARQLGDLVARARAGKLAPADMSGGTFTISNHGVSGSLLATPIIISQPQSAILGVGKLEKRVVVREVDGGDTIQIRPLCYVSLTIDHRVVDGHQTNAWLTAFVAAIEGWPLDG